MSSAVFCPKLFKELRIKFSKERKTENKRPLPVMPCSVSSALLPLSLNRMHFTLPCILATAISASFQTGINHRRENVWEICAVLSVLRMPPVLCLNLFFCSSLKLHLLIPKHQPFQCTHENNTFTDIRAQC